MEAPSYKLLRDHSLSSGICDLIESSRLKCIIVSPYIKPWTHAWRSIEKALNKEVHLEFFVRETEKPQDERALTELQQNLTSLGGRFSIFTVPLLHAKVYRNEERAILGSMNFYEFSAGQSRELGLDVTDADMLRQIDEQLSDYRRSSKEHSSSFTSKLARRVMSAITPQPEPMPAKKVVRAKPVRSSVPGRTSTPGHCIRCEDGVGFNPKKPMCSDCYSKFGHYPKDDQWGRRCHRCGKPEETTTARPLCGACFRETAR